MKTEEEIGNEPFRVYIAHADATTGEAVRAMTTKIGHVVEMCVPDGETLIRVASSKPADVMIVGRKLADMRGIDALLKIGEVRPRPSVILTGPDGVDSVQEAMKDHVMSYLVEPLTEHDLRPALYLAQRRFAYLESLKSQVDELQRKLEDRKVIERAKGVIMKAENLSEPQAHRRLQELSRKRRMKLRQTAEDVLRRGGCGDRSITDRSPPTSGRTPTRSTAGPLAVRMPQSAESTP